MAEHAQLSPRHFRALFREQFGLSPGNYLQRTRLIEATRRLREMAEPIKRIAAALGYNELANFYRTFRRVIGETPAAYRQRHALRG